MIILMRAGGALWQALAIEGRLSPAQGQEPNPVIACVASLIEPSERVLPCWRWRVERLAPSKMRHGMSRKRRQRVLRGTLACRGISFTDSVALVTERRPTWGPAGRQSTGGSAPANDGGRSGTRSGRAFSRDCFGSAVVGLGWRYR